MTACYVVLADVRSCGFAWSFVVVVQCRIFIMVLIFNILYKMFSDLISMSSSLFCVQTLSTMQCEMVFISSFVVLLFFFWFIFEKSFITMLTVSLCVGVVTGPLKENQIAFVIRETLHGLQYLHNLGKMHRDVKVSDLLC